ncbi:hypothetical protein D030_2366B, partial [Vibrio parahaemolyticus AQ3810]
CSNFQPRFVPCPAVFSITATTSGTVLCAKLIDSAIVAKHSCSETFFR